MDIPLRQYLCYGVRIYETLTVDPESLPPCMSHMQSVQSAIFSKDGHSVLRIPAYLQRSLAVGKHLAGISDKLGLGFKV